MHLLALLCIQIRVRHTSVSANYISNSIADCPSRFNPYSPAVSPGTGAPVPLEAKPKAVAFAKSGAGLLELQFKSGTPIQKSRVSQSETLLKITYWEYPKPLHKLRVIYKPHNDNVAYLHLCNVSSTCLLLSFHFLWLHFERLYSCL